MVITGDYYTYVYQNASFIGNNDPEDLNLWRDALGRCPLHICQ